MAAYRASPDYAFALRAIRDVDIAEGDIGAVRTRYSKAFPELVGNLPPRIHDRNLLAAVDLACVLQRSGESDQATVLLDQAERFSAGKSRLGINGIGIIDAQIYALRGEPAKALAALRSIVQAGWRLAWRYHRDTDPALASIRDEPEFKAVFADIERDMERQRADLAARPKDAPLDLATVH
jgi:hypothetical protein